MLYGAGKPSQPRMHQTCVTGHLDYDFRHGKAAGSKSLMPPSSGGFFHVPVANPAAARSKGTLESLSPLNPFCCKYMRST